MTVPADTRQSAGLASSAAQQVTLPSAQQHPAGIQDTEQQGPHSQLDQQGSAEQEQPQAAASSMLVFCCAGEPCTVCHEDFEIGTEVVQLPCRHCFHEVCLLPWLRTVSLG